MLTDGLECCDVFIRLSFWRHPFTAVHPLTLILTAPIHCSASIDSHSDGTHSLQGIHWLILTASIHCRASIDSHSDGIHSLQSIHWLSFWRHPFTAEHPLTLILTAPIHCRASIAEIFLQTWWRNNLIYTTSQKFLNSKIFLCCLKKSLLLTKPAFIWSDVQQKLKSKYLLNCNLFLYFQHHYSSLQCHMIFRNHNNMLIYDQETWLLSMLNTVLH